MARLTPEQISRLTAIMDERFVREMAEIGTVAVRSRDERLQTSLAAGSADRLEAALAVDYAVVRQDVADVRDILAARKRLSTGQFGFCTDCGKPVGYERLLAYPTAKRCIDCQRLHERHKTVREGRRAP